MRFYSVDPAEQGASPYLYCGNNPIMLVDPDGEIAWFAIAAVTILAHGVYNGVQTANATGNPFDFIVSFNSTVISEGAMAASMYALAVPNGCLSPGIMEQYFASKPFSAALVNAKLCLVVEMVQSTMMSGGESTSLLAMNYDWGNGKFSMESFSSKKTGWENAMTALSYMESWNALKDLHTMVTYTSEDIERLDRFFSEHPNIQRGVLDEWTDEKYIYISPEEAEEWLGPSEQGSVLWLQNTREEPPKKIELNTHYSNNRYWKGGIHGADDVVYIGPDGNFRLEFRLHMDYDVLSLHGTNGIAHLLVEAPLSNPGQWYSMTEVGAFLRPWAPYIYNSRFMFR